MSRYFVFAILLFLGSTFAGPKKEAELPEFLNVCPTEYDACLEDELCNLCITKVYEDVDSKTTIEDTTCEMWTEWYNSVMLDHPEQCDEAKDEAPLIQLFICMNLANMENDELSDCSVLQTWMPSMAPTFAPTSAPTMLKTQSPTPVLIL